MKMYCIEKIPEFDLDFINTFDILMYTKMWNEWMPSA